MATQQAQAIDMDRVQEIAGKVIGDLGAVMSAALVVIGDKLGLYKAMAGAGPLTPTELAKRTRTTERYVREWLQNQAASGFVDYTPATGKFTLSNEAALVFANEDSPAYMAGGYEVTTSAIKIAPRMVEAFRTGRGVAWGEHDSGLFIGTERFFRPGYLSNLTQQWIPALTGVEAKLKAGGMVADVGCGYGLSTRIMAQAYPKSRLIGFDNHGPSIEYARKEASATGLSSRMSFEVASADSYPGGDYDLIAFFDTLHDIGDPVGVLKHAYHTLVKDGAVMLVEPMAGESIEDNINPVGRVFSAASVLICTPNAMTTGGDPLGTLASESKLREVARAAGFTRFRRAAETIANRVFELQK